MYLGAIFNHRFFIQLYSLYGNLWKSLEPRTPTEYFAGQDSLMHCDASVVRNKSAFIQVFRTKEYLGGVAEVLFRKINAIFTCLCGKLPSETAYLVDGVNPLCLL